MRCLLAINHREVVLAAIPPGGTMLEWGCGGSSLWFAERLHEAQKLITVEHDDSWLNEVRQAVGNRTNWLPSLRRSTLPVGQNATPWEECPAGLAEYIVPVSPEALASVDVFLVDGVARGACLATAALYAKAGTTVFIHDLQRTWYDWILSAPRFTDQHLIEAKDGEYPPPLWCARVK